MFCATTKGDEAYLLLSALDGVSSAGVFCANVSQAALFAGVGLLFLAKSGGFLTTFNIFPKLTEWALTISRWGGIAIAAAPVVFLAGVLMLVLVTLALRGHRLGYGERLVDALLLDVYVRPYPPGMTREDVHVFPAEGRGLRHSALYRSPLVVRAIAEWFTRTVASASDPTPTPAAPESTTLAPSPRAAGVAPTQT
jgi:hypothetical protein